MKQNSRSWKAGIGLSFLDSGAGKAIEEVWTCSKAQLLDTLGRLKMNEVLHVFKPELRIKAYFLRKKHLYHHISQDGVRPNSLVGKLTHCRFITTLLPVPHMHSAPSPEYSGVVSIPIQCHRVHSMLLVIPSIMWGKSGEACRWH